MAAPNDPLAARPRLGELAGLRRGTTTADALAFFDTLPPADVDAIAGRWRGAGLPTGHPLDGVLEALGWVGKRFDGVRDAHPLVFAGPRGGPFAVDPAFVPLPLVLRCAPLLRRPGVARVVRALLPLARTRRPRARLRTVVHRGAATAAMTYDALPVEDVFRAVDGDTLLGLMEARGMERPFFFVLRRAVPIQVPGQPTLPWSSRRQ
ncbi:hypothetical protein FB00_19380 [Cellulosimicrobium funkei]|uniref:DUF4334 domain-containing protein n=1 Tax=Cellulosimicrobium funkei TaxID=264251 RepID=A0A0H2KHJ5_9MICO|nr:GXWXG domain-containing protein [Cellulosimicrobium funkei]KLN33105.1 hypothetical protein FB00_19380 [Cellulosimicrobium funkei]